jgi:nucleoside-diphosphate-sugar epimerase
MKALFIGGTGIISSACTKRALEKGIDLYHLNRGKTQVDSPISFSHQILADIRNRNEAEKALKNHTFDVVVDWISFLPSQLKSNLELFKGKTNQFIFISSASAYQTPPLSLPVTENTPLHNPFWQYSRDKIACEELLIMEAKKYGLNYTIIRPSHTYNKTLIPMPGEYTTLHRIIKGLPVIVPGDGTSIWTLTHNTDFAKGLVGILNNSKAFNEIFHITSDEWITWNQIYQLFGQAVGKEPKLIPIPSSIIAKYDSEMGDGLLGDKCHSMIFDNTKIKSVVPEFNCEIKFEQGAKEIAEWYNKNPDKQIVDAKLNKMFDKIIEDYTHS